MLRRMLATSAAGRRQFVRTYRCHSVAMIQKSAQAREKIEQGGKIIMPQSALEQLASLSVRYPMLFEVRNPNLTKKMHCGVLEFSAEEGFVHLPYWMMQNLFLEEGDLVRLTSVNLPSGTHVTIQPQTTNFLDITNPKAVLESELRNLSALTKGDVLAIRYNNKVYSLEILDLKPQEAVSIVETDLNVEFAPVPGAGQDQAAPPPSPRVAPKGGLTFRSTSRDALGQSSSAAVPEPSASSSGEPRPTPPAEKPRWTPFQGTGYRLDGRPAAPSPSPSLVVSPPRVSRDDALVKDPEEDARPKKFQSFAGQGHTL